MQIYFLQLLSMVIGTGLVLFGAAVRKSWEDGNSFSFPVFVQENLNRLVLALFGLLVVSLAIYIDPLGLEAIQSMLPVEVTIGAPIVTGVAIGGLCLIAKKNIQSPGQ